MTPTSHLTQPYYIQLDPTTWCATAQVSNALIRHFTLREESVTWQISAGMSPIDGCDFTALKWQYYAVTLTLSARETAQHQRQLQKQGVRLLLNTLLSELNISDSLDESSFPYRLSHSGYYVCFSHTSGAKENNVRNRSVLAGDKQIKSSVAVIISRHRPVGIDIENHNVKWRVAQRFYSKNELVAIQSLPSNQRDRLAKLLWQIKEGFIKIHQYTLAQGLGMDYAYLIPDLMCGLEAKSAIQVLKDHLSHYHIAILPNQHTVVVF